jgi:prepilin-type N-terminal cleavage/methylation domain-containing protein
MMNPRAFTIVELLTVIGIVAVLAGLLFPVLSKVRQRSHLTQDVVQMREIYIGTYLYSQDANDQLPPSLLETLPYAKSEKLFVSAQDPYANGIPGVPDFPANLDDGKVPRSPIRISFAYLCPMAIDAGYDDNWINHIREIPQYGLIATSMYNDPFRIEAPFNEVDIMRWLSHMHRICMDGSYKEASGEFGVSWQCGISSCFGEPLDYPL